jgi:hypothetical protein
MSVDMSASPRERIHQAVSAYGEDGVVRWCTELLDGAGPDAVSSEAALVLGGRHARALLADPAADHAWWWRVWGLRGLLYVWEDTARKPVWHALDDEAWRVREGALRVIARRRLDEDLQRVADMREDRVPRVRSAAERALVRLEER